MLRCYVTGRCVNVGKIELFKEWHLSALQTISVRSLYIKIINYRDSISANLNNTMQTKQHAMKKRTFIQIETRFTRDYFCDGRILCRKCSKSSIFVNSISWNCIFYSLSLFLEVLLFLCARDILNRVQIVFKTILIFFTENFWEKIDINFKCLNKINLVF